MLFVPRGFGRTGGPKAGWGSAAAWALALGASLAIAGTAGAQTPITAEDAVRIALERNPTLLTSEAEVRAASGSRLATRSALLPNLDAGLQWRILDETRTQLVGSEVVIDDETSSGSVNLDQTLLNFTSWNRNKAAEHVEDATRYGYQADRADVAISTYRQFYVLLKQMKLHTVAEQNLQLTRDQLRRTQALFELGSVARGDVLKQQLQVSTAELGEITARRLSLVEKARLAALLGLQMGEAFEIDTTLTAGTLDVDSASVIQDAVNNRPELANLRSRLESAGASVSAAKGLRYPSLGAFGSYSFSSPGKFNEVADFDKRSGFWSGGLALGIPIFDGMNAKGQIRQAKARESQAQYALRQQELDIIVDVEEALQLASQSNERIRVTTDALAVAEEDLKLSQERYNVGSATVIELIDAQVALTRARSEYVSALADFRFALANLRRARGEHF